MYKSLFALILLLSTFTTSPGFALFESVTSFFSNDCFCSDCSCTCCQSLEIAAGWRRDNLDWKTTDMHSNYISANVDDHLIFKDINSYTISAQTKWVSSAYYVRLSGEYGWTDKGRAHEHFKIKSPYLYGPVGVETSDPIKRRSEVYDFDGAVGYPLAFCNCRLSIIPLIGFSFHRQHLRVKTGEHSDSYDSYGSYGSYGLRRRDSSDYSSSFTISDSNPLVGFPSSNPFSSASDPNIASELGLSNPHETNNYRFTWYGFYLGADMAYAADSCWTIFWDTEIHFLNNCHRKRESWTGVYFVDDYHEKGYAYGFNNFVGVNCHICSCWYGTMVVDFDWWKADSKHDTLHWKKVGAKIGLIGQF